MDLAPLAILLAAVAPATDPHPPSAPLPPTEIGRGERIDFVPDLSGAGRTENGYFYAALIARPTASFVKPHFVDLHLSPGDVLTVRSRGGAVVETLTGRGPRDRGSFWGLSAFGNELILELEFAAPYSRPPFRIDHVVLGDSGLLSALPPKSLCGVEDYDDAICFQSDAAKWRNVEASLGIMTVGGDPLVALWCSGANVSPLGYVLTNAHCIDSALGCANSEFVFRYWRTQCNVGAPTTDWVSFHCAEFTTGSPLGDCEPALDSLDFSLLKTLGDPTPEFGFVQPDPTPLTDGEAIYIVQHPDGRPRELTHGSGANVDVDGHTLRYYGTLDTDEGSSGAPIFRESNDEMVALHHCGGCATPGQGNRGMLMSDLHPHLAPYVCNPPLSIVVNDVAPLVEIFGDGDPFLDPGETFEFRLKLTNMSSVVDAKDVVAAVAPAASSAAIWIWQPAASFADIPSCSTKEQVGSIRFTISPEAACSGEVAIDLVAISAGNGGPFPGKSKLVAKPIGSGGSATLYATDFDETTPSWSLVDRGAAFGFDGTWQLSWDPSLPFVAPYAIASADLAGEELMDDALLTPKIDCRGWGAVTLQFRFDFDVLSGGIAERGDVDVRSRATGGTWVNVASYGAGDDDGIALLNLTPHAADESDVEVRFRYWNAQRSGHFAIDDLFVIGFAAPCGSTAFTSLGGGCPGLGGAVPALTASGAATPGGKVALAVTGGPKDTIGALFVAVASLPDGCLRLKAPLLGPYLLALDGLGGAKHENFLPPSLTTGIELCVQWFGADGSASNAIEIAID